MIGVAAFSESGHSLRGLSAPLFVTVTNYISNCQDAYSILTYGTNMCLATTSSNNGANSFQYSWNSETSELSELYYSDNACSSLVSSEVLLNFDTFTEGVCQSDVEFVTSASFSNPTADGVTYNYYISNENCGSDIPISSIFASSDVIDDGYYDQNAVTCKFVPITFVHAGSPVMVTASVFQTSILTDTGHSSSSSSHHKSCFAGTETVLVEDGTRKPISEVEIGDSVLSANANGQTVFSAVVAVPHTKNDDLARFLVIEGDSGSSIKLTDNHLLSMSRDCDGKLELIPASSVSKGMCLVSTSGLDPISSVSDQLGRGLYTIITEEEYVVINGYLASPFAVNHAVAHTYYKFVRYFPAILQSQYFHGASEYFGGLIEAFISQ